MRLVEGAPIFYSALSLNGRRPFVLGIMVFLGLFLPLQLGLFWSLASNAKERFHEFLSLGKEKRALFPLAKGSQYPPLSRAELLAAKEALASWRENESRDALQRFLVLEAILPRGLFIQKISEETHGKIAIEALAENSQTIETFLGGLRKTPGVGNVLLRRQTPTKSGVRTFTNITVEFSL